MERATDSRSNQNSTVDAGVIPMLDQLSVVAGGNSTVWNFLD